MSQGSYMQYVSEEFAYVQNKGKKRKFDDGGYEDDLKPAKKQKPKKDFSHQRQQKRGELV